MLPEVTMSAFICNHQRKSTVPHPFLIALKKIKRKKEQIKAALFPQAHKNILFKVQQSK